MCLAKKFWVEKHCTRFASQMTKRRKDIGTIGNIDKISKVGGVRA